jgi:hypothetical protein
VTASTAVKVHICIDCKKNPPATVRKVWSKLKPSDPRRCGEHGRAWRDHNREVSWASRIRREWNIEPELYWAIYDAQGGRCAMPRCTATGKTKMLAVEHDHDVARRECDHDPKRGCKRCIRGLMCGPHNYELIGKFKNSLQDALDYLAHPPAREVLDHYVRYGTLPVPVDAVRSALPAETG